MADAREVAQRYAELFMEKFDEIDPTKWQKPWMSPKVGSVRNITGREYRRSNRLLLSILCDIKGWDMPFFMTWNQANRLGVNVTKGEKSFPVVWFKDWYEKGGKRISSDEYDALNQDEKKDWMRKYSMSYNNVFNIGQTNFREERPDQWEALEAKVKNVIETKVQCSCEAFDIALKDQFWLCPITQNDGDRAYYSPSEDRIVMPKKENFPDQREFYGTLSHEMVHSTGTKERLDRDMSGIFGNESYAREELVAELGSAILSSITGLESSIREDNLQYLKSWIEAIGNDPGIITGAISEAAAAAELIDKTIGISERLSKNAELNMKEIIPDIETLSEKEETKKSNRLNATLQEQTERHRSRGI